MFGVGVGVTCVVPMAWFTSRSGGAEKTASVRPCAFASAARSSQPRPPECRREGSGPRTARGSRREARGTRKGPRQRSAWAYAMLQARGQAAQGPEGSTAGPRAHLARPAAARRRYDSDTVTFERRSDSCTSKRICWCLVWLLLWYRLIVNSFRRALARM